MLVRCGRGLELLLVLLPGEHDHAAGALAAGAACALREPRGGADAVVHDNQVHLADVEALLRDARGDEHVHLAAPELGHDAPLLLLRLAQQGVLRVEGPGGRGGVVRGG